MLKDIYCDILLSREQARISMLLQVPARCIKESLTGISLCMSECTKMAEMQLYEEVAKRYFAEVDKR